MRTLESFEITLALSERRSTTYFSQHYFVERSPSLVICVSSLLWYPLKEGSAYPTYGLKMHSRSTAVCWFYVNNSTARRFYYHTEHVHGGRREFHRGVKSLENRVDKIENGKYWFHSTLGSAAVERQGCELMAYRSDSCRSRLSA